MHLMSQAQKDPSHALKYIFSVLLSLELYNLISDMKIKPEIIGISESRLKTNKKQITNISLTIMCLKYPYRIK